jgi:hypothetical protein
VGGTRAAISTASEDFRQSERPRQPVDVGLAIDEGGVGKAVRDILADVLEDGIGKAKVSRT